MLHMAIERPERYNSADWFYALMLLPKSTVLYRIRSHVLINILFSAIVVGIYNMYPTWEIWNATPVVHELLGTIMGLLLVFRTNAAYDRFWEGRKLFSELEYHARNLAFSVVNSLGPESKSADPSAAKMTVKLIELYAETLVQHLRGITIALDVNHTAVLTQSQREELSLTENQPLYIAQLISSQIAKSLELTNRNDVRDDLQEDVKGLVQVLTCCERIVRTPVPLSYSRHTSRFLSLWCLTLPFVLVRYDDWLTIFTNAFMSWALFSIEEIGHLIEDPFCNSRFSLNLEAICAGLRTELDEILIRAKLLARNPDPMRELELEKQKEEWLVKREIL